MDATTTTLRGEAANDAARDARPDTLSDTHAIIAWAPPEVTPKQVTYATWVCFFAWALAVYDFILFGTLLPRLGEHFQWTAAEQARLNTWVTLGTGLVAFGIGPIVDRLGRRKGIIIAVCGAAICSGLTAVAGWVAGASAGLGFVLLVLVRSLAGLGYAEQTINATYLSELFAVVHTDPAATRRRGLIYALVQGGWPIGAVLTAVLVTLLYPLGERWFGAGGGWSLSFLFAMFPAVVIVILGRRLVETPQFLTARRIAELQAAGKPAHACALAITRGVELEVGHDTGIGAMFRGSFAAAAAVAGAGLPAELVRDRDLHGARHLGAGRLGRHAGQGGGFLERAAGADRLQPGGLPGLRVPRLAGRPHRAAQHGGARLDGGRRGLLGHVAGAAGRLLAHRAAVLAGAVLPDGAVCGGAVPHRRELSEPHPRDRGLVHRRAGAARRDRGGLRHHAHAVAGGGLGAGRAVLGRVAVPAVGCTDVAGAACGPADFEMNLQQRNQGVTMNQSLKFIIRATVTATLLLLIGPCFAQDAYPTKPVRMVVGYPPGGATDGAARIVANKLGPVLGQPVVMDNKPGVGSTLGTAAVAHAAPDGYTLLMGNTTAMSIAPHLYKKLGYDPRRDLVPVALIGRVPLVLFVHPSVPATDLKGLVELLKKSAGKYDYATFGNGSSAHLTMEMLKGSAGVDIRHVPYKGSSAAINDVLGGQVPLAMDTMQSTQQHFVAGKLRPIAMSGEERSTLAPELPTFAELGYPKMTLSPWYGVFVPAGTPGAIVEQLASAISRSMRTSDMQAQLATQGAELMVLTGAAARDFLDEDDARWAEAARISGAQLD